MTIAISYRPCPGGALQEQPHHADDGDGLQLPGRACLVPQLGQACCFSSSNSELEMLCVNWLSDPIFFGRLIKHVNEMDEGVFLSYSSPSCYLAALNSDPGQVFVCLYVFSLPSHYHGAGVADQARRLLPLRLGPTRLLDRILLVEADLKVAD